MGVESSFHCFRINCPNFCCACGWSTVVPDRMGVPLVAPEHDAWKTAFLFVFRPIFWGELWNFKGRLGFRGPPTPRRQSWITWMAEPFLSDDFEWNAWNFHEHIVLVPHIESWISSGRITPTIQILFYYLTTKNKHDTNNHTSHAGTNITNQTTNTHSYPPPKPCTSRYVRLIVKRMPKTDLQDTGGTPWSAHFFWLSNVSTPLIYASGPGLDLILCPGWSMFSGHLFDPRLRSLFWNTST